MSNLSFFQTLVFLILITGCTPSDSTDTSSAIKQEAKVSLISKNEYFLSESLSVIDTVIQFSNFRLRYHDMPWPASEALKNIIAELEQQAEKVRKFCSQSEAVDIQGDIFPTIEAKGLATGSTQPCEIDKSNATFALVANEAFGNIYLGAQNQLLLQSYLGKPSLPVLETGLSIYFNNKWQKKGYHYWAAHLALSDNLPALSKLLDPSYQDIASPLVLGTASASFVHFLIREWGADTFCKNYTSWKPDTDETEQLEQKWLEYLKKDKKKDKQHTPSPLPYLKGFNFAHEGYSIYNGYGSKLSAAALYEQTSLGANTIALVPYSYLRSPDQPSRLPFMDRAGTETDESMIADLYHCNKLGLKTVLKPQIWLGHNSWPGAVEMKSEKDWQLFFDYYYQWMRHYALFAAIHEVDMLCVGVEFAKSTLQRPEDWKRLIGRLRDIYHGPMSYAANWGEEFEKISFWKDLDYIGLNCYYPLSKENNPSEEMLRSSFDQILAKAQRISNDNGRPLLFTEIGFTSTPAPWVQPHKDGQNKQYASQPQQMCYEIVMKALLDQEAWCKGILWWKYPSFVKDRAKKHTGFSPKNKPASEVLESYFYKLP